MRIKNWKVFQHFKDRCPPWIKLHRSTLDQRDIMTLSDRNFRMLVCFWMLASEDKGLNGELPPVADIAFRLRREESEIVESIQQLEDFIDCLDIKAISEQCQVVPPETEVEAYKEESDKQEVKKVKRFAPPSQKEVDDYCLERSNGVNSIKWMNHYTANGWMVGRNKMKSWKAAVRTWEESAPKSNAIQSVGDM